MSDEPCTRVLSTSKNAAAVKSTGGCSGPGAASVWASISARSALALAASSSRSSSSGSGPALGPGSTVSGPPGALTVQQYPPGSRGAFGGGYVGERAALTPATLGP